MDRFIKLWFFIQVRTCCLSCYFEPYENIDENDSCPAPPMHARHIYIMLRCPATWTKRVVKCLIKTWSLSEARIVHHFGSCECLDGREEWVKWINCETTELKIGMHPLPAEYRSRQAVNGVDTACLIEGGWVVGRMDTISTIHHKEFVVLLVSVAWSGSGQVLVGVRVRVAWILNVSSVMFCYVPSPTRHKTAAC